MFDFQTPAPDERAQAAFLLYQGGQLLCSLRASPPCVFSAADLGAMALPVQREEFLGHWDGRPWFAVQLVDDAGFDSLAFTLSTFYQLLGRVPEPVFALAGRGLQLLRFAAEHRYCSRCGGVMQPAAGERAMSCGACEQSVYPPIAPCIIVLVTRGEQLLLARNARFPRPMFSTLAGFVEAGESAEQCLVREVQEEVGLAVHNIRYFGSQAWPFPNQLMLGYFAEYAGGELRCDPEEIAEADWFEAHALPAVPPPVSISGQLIRHFAAQVQA
jgi:NAD+ diphosphatase